MHDGRRGLGIIICLHKTIEAAIWSYAPTIALCGRRSVFCASFPQLSSNGIAGRTPADHETSIMKRWPLLAQHQGIFLLLCLAQFRALCAVAPTRSYCISDPLAFCPKPGVVFWLPFHLLVHTKSSCCFSAGTEGMTPRKSIPYGFL